VTLVSVRKLEFRQGKVILCGGKEWNKLTTHFGFAKMMTVDPELRPSGVDMSLCMLVQHLLSVTSVSLISF
jgi:hypothetical protein